MGVPWMEHDVPELLEPEVEDLFDLAPDVVHEAFDLSEQGLLVREGTADHAVFVVFPVSGKGAHAVDPPLGVLGLPGPKRDLSSLENRCPTTKTHSAPSSCRLWW